ncbi:hypothetical protein, partial [Thiolapillus sp.]|uniref:hypothetical protein n=1 Tax=Thiolapillus sp. TaxID=2017437 RepID=UPI003AF9D97B
DIKFSSGCCDCGYFIWNIFNLWKIHIKPNIFTIIANLIRDLDYPPSSAARQPNLVASNPADIGKPGFLMMQTKVDFDQIWQCKEATR